MPRPLNILAEQLARVCREHAAAEKWLVMPSAASGEELVCGMTRAGRDLANLRVTSAGRLAKTIAGTKLSEKCITPASDIESLLAAEEAAILLHGRAGSYMGDLHPTRGLARRVRDTVRELRLAGVSPEALRGGMRDAPGKADDLVFLMGKIRDMLGRMSLADDKDVFDAARDAIGEGESRFAGRKPILIIAEDAGESAAARALFEAAGRAGARIIRIKAECSTGLNVPEGTELSVVKALTPSCEVKEMLRSILREGIPFDEVEIAVTDPETYVPILLEEAERLDRAPDGSLCMTFQSGLPAALSRPARALVAAARWVETGFRADLLHDMLGDGLFDLKGNSMPPAHRAAAYVREARIRFGAGRYVPCLEALAAEHGRKGDVRPGEETKSLSAWAGRLVALFAPLDRTTAAPLSTISRVLSEFLESFALSASIFDGSAKEVLAGYLRIFGKFEGLEATVSSLGSRISSIIKETRVGQERSRPAAIHVSTVSEAGYSGRPRLFVAGLDSSRFPGKGLQDPLLLDHERERLSGLRPAFKKVEDNDKALRRLIENGRWSSVTLSFPCFDPVEDRRLFPAPFLLAAMARVNGGRSVNFEEMDRLLPMKGVLPEPGEPALSPEEELLSRVAGSRFPSDHREETFRLFPGFGSGFEAAQRRASGQPSEFTGLIGAGREELLPCRPESPTSSGRLETAEKCPFRYLFEHILGIKPAVEVRPDEDTWLDPAARGELLHEVFKKVLVRASSEGGALDPKHESLAVETAEHLVRERAEQIPPPAGAVFEKERADILDAARLFIRAELERRARKKAEAEPVRLEWQFGWGKEIPGPVPVDIGPDCTVWLRGRIDRVDRLGRGSHDYEVIDYKTGRPAESIEDRGVLQHGLYAAAAETLLRRKIDQSARVVSSGYFYCTFKGGLLDLFADAPAGLESVRNRLNHILDRIREGNFTPPAAEKDRKDCSWCDYLLCCAAGAGKPPAFKREEMPKDEAEKSAGAGKTKKGASGK